MSIAVNITKGVNMKKFVASLVAVFALAVSAVGVASAAPVTATPPAECTGVYTNQVNSTIDADYVRGTSGNDLIIVNHDRTYVVAGQGNDCIVVNSGAEANYVTAGAGADTIVDNGFRNSLQGNGGNDKIYARDGAGASLNGGAGVDVCNSNPNDSSEKNCEL